MAEKSTANRLYPFRFELRPNQVRKIVEIIVSNFDEAKLDEQDVASRRTIEFKVTFENKKTLHLTELEKIFSQPTSASNPVKKSVIKATEDSENSPIRTCTITYNMPSFLDEDILILGKSRGVGISVEGDNQRWVNQITNELEEVIQPTLLKGWFYNLADKLTRGLPLAIVAIFIVSYAVGILRYSSLNPSAPQVATNTSEIQAYQVKVDQLVSNANKLKTNDEKIDFLFKLRLLELNKPPTKLQTPSWHEQLPSQGILMKIGILLACLLIAFYILKNFYPNCNFIWGDYERHYNSLVNQRNIWWGGVLLAITVNILSGLFYLY